MNKIVERIKGRDWEFSLNSNGVVNAILYTGKGEVESLIRLNLDNNIVCNSFDGSNVVLNDVVKNAITFRGLNNYA